MKGRNRRQHEVDAPLGRDRVKLVEEEHARLRCLSAVKQVPDALLARADVLVEDFGALDADEVEAALFRDGRGEQRLAASRKSVQEQAGGNMGVVSAWRGRGTGGDGTHPDRRRSGHPAKMAPYFVGHSSVSRSVLRASCSPPMSAQATSLFCSLTSRSESGTKPCCAAAKSSAVRMRGVSEPAAEEGEPRERMAACCTARSTRSRRSAGR